MKRILAVLALVVVFVMVFASCNGGEETKIGKCDLCQTDNVSVTGITLEGETEFFCADCYDTAKALADMYSSGALDAYM